MNQENLIISLIKDNLINTRLVNGLDKLGLDASNYSLNLSDTIFKLMEIDEEELFERYLGWCEEATKRDIFKHPELLEIYATEIYRKLMEGKEL
ncbi:MAG: hypothetical protein H0W84_00275 [Bacteroidetes bacterium]|nr:hypothetical protein [Bacteroidota bacterium]